MDWDEQVLSLGIAAIVGGGLVSVWGVDWNEALQKENRGLIAEMEPRCPFPQVDVLIWRGEDKGWNRMCVKSEGEVKRKLKEKIK
jgi:hypothetical protein